MSIFWGLTTNNESIIECILAPYANQLGRETGDAGAWGLGYYSQGEVLSRIEPKKQGELIDISQLSVNLRAEILLMHTRSATVGDLRRENVHPFRSNHWLFAHNGTIEGFSTFKEALVNTIPTFIRRGIRGNTDSEHLFHSILSFLYDGGHYNHTNPGISIIQDAMVRAVALVDELAFRAGAPCSPGSFIISDGYSLVAFSRGIPVDYTLIEGIPDCPICRKSIPPGEELENRVSHEKLKAVLLCSENKEATHAGFARLPANSLLLIDHTHHVEIVRAP